MYTRPVEREYQVDVVMKIVSVERLLRYKEYDYIVIDVMMPTQTLNSNDEMTSGFVLYRDILRSMNLQAKIIFWSRLDDDSFHSFWGDDIPQNCWFLHKTRTDNHLLLYIKSLERE